MRFIYKSSPIEFKNRTNPKTKSYFNVMIGHNYAHIKTYRIIERLRKHLFAQTAIMTSPLNFTLCNVTSLLAAISYGYSQEPINVLRFDSTIAFTFALRADADLQYKSAPAFVKKVTHETTFWGYQHLHEFVTISIEVADILEEGLSIKDFEYLYLVIGSVTKNFAMFKEAALHSMPKDKQMLVRNYQNIYNLDLATLFYTVPYAEWVYNKDAWSHCPEVIASSQIHAYSALYYSIFLSSKTLTAKYIVNLDGCGHLLNELYKFYLKSQQQLISNQVGETDDSDEADYLTNFVYPTAVYEIFAMMNTPGYRDWKPKARLSNLYEWLDKITAKMQEDLYLFNDIQFICQMPSLAKDAIINKIATFRKASVIMGEQSRQTMFSQK